MQLGLIFGYSLLKTICYSWFLRSYFLDFVLLWLIIIALGRLCLMNHRLVSALCPMGWQRRFYQALSFDFETCFHSNGFCLSEVGLPLPQKSLAELRVILISSAWLGCFLPVPLAATLRSRMSPWWHQCCHH